MKKNFALANSWKTTGKNLRKRAVESEVNHGSGG
jgi:hypothetical protein